MSQTNIIFATIIFAATLLVTGNKAKDVQSYSDLEEEVRLLRAKVQVLESKDLNLTDIIQIIQRLDAEVSDLRFSIGLTSEIVDEHTISIEDNTNRITNSEGNIAAIQTHIDEFENRFNASTLRFHVESHVNEIMWPYNSVLTYATELVDTHSAMDPHSGTFTAPLDGTYGFMLYADISTEYTTGHLFVVHNGAKSEIFSSETVEKDMPFQKSSTVYFALKMSAGDTVKIDSGKAQILLYFHPVKFTGFLMNKLNEEL